MRMFFILSCSAYLLRNNVFMQKISWTIAGIVAYTLVCAGGVMLAFSAAITCWPLQDNLMIHADKLLGYDWHAYGELINSSKAIKNVFQFAYSSINWQPPIIILALSLQNKHSQIFSYLLSTMVALILTMAIFTLFPVTTAWTYGTLVDVKDAARLGMNDNWVSELEQLRHGQLRTITWGIVGAVIGFPSFHCIAAIVNTWHLWRYRGFRYFGIPLNIILIAASLIFGGHYLVDLIAGGLVAIASIAIAQRVHLLLVRQRPSAPIQRLEALVAPSG